MANVTIINTEEHLCHAISWAIDECDNWKTLPIVREVGDEIRTSFAKTKKEWGEHLDRFKHITQISSDIKFVVDFEFENEQDAFMFILKWG